LDEYRAAWLQNGGQTPSKRKRQRVKSFAKAEPYVPVLKNIRWINSRSDSFKVYAGPAFKDIEEQVYASKFFVKHVPIPDRPDLILSFERAGRRYYITDYKAFESHMTVQVMQAIECNVYRFFLKKFPELARVICSTIAGTNRCRNACGVRCKLKGRRMSGDMCTSLGNGLTNLFLALYILEELKGVPLSEVDILVEGDDGLLAIPSHVEISKADWLSMGFTLSKLVETKRPGEGTAEAAFCGMNIIRDEQGRGWNIKPLVPWISKFAWALRARGSHSVRLGGLLRAKALSALCELPNCPIVSVIARVALEMTQCYDPVYIEDGYHHYDATPGDFQESASVREAYYSLTGIDPETQKRVERSIQNCRDVKVLESILIPNACQQRYWAGWVESG